MRPSHNSCLGPTQNPDTRIVTWWCTFWQSTHTHHWCPHQYSWQHWLLYWWHTRTYHWHPRNWECITTQSSNSPCYEVTAWPDDKNEPIPCKAIVTKDKLLAEGSLLEKKSFWDSYLISGHSPSPSLITSSLHGRQQLKKVITLKRNTSKDLDTTIQWMEHVGFMIPWI